MFSGIAGNFLAWNCFASNWLELPWLEWLGNALPKFSCLEFSYVISLCLKLPQIGLPGIFFNCLGWNCLQLPCLKLLCLGLPKIPIPGNVLNVIAWNCLASNCQILIVFWNCLSWNCLELPYLEVLCLEMPGNVLSKSAFLELPGFALPGISFYEIACSGVYWSCLT